MVLTIVSEEYTAYFFGIVISYYELLQIAGHAVARRKVAGSSPHEVDFFQFT
jgi:hypothetical protein